MQSVPFESIVCPTDFSDCSTNALRWAVWPVALFLAAFGGVMGVILLVSFLSQVLRYPGPNSCPEILWGCVISSIIATAGVQLLIVRQLEKAAARD